MAGTISFDGLATGIKSADTVDKLIAVEGRPKLLKQAEKVRLENQRASWQELNTRLLAVKVAAGDLSRLATWNTASATSSHESVLGATAALGAPEGTYTLRVDALAKAHQLATPADPGGTPADPGYASLDALFGVGDLKLTAGGVTTTLTLTADTGTLDGAVAAINAAKLGVTASAVFNGSGYQLLLTAKATGVANQITVDATGLDTTGARDLSGAWSTVQAAQDAAVSLGSGAGAITVTSATNTLSTLLQGVTLNLKAAQPGTDVTLTVARESAGLADKVKAFVGAYNDAFQYLRQQFAYDAETGVAGILMGDSSLVGIQRSLGSTLLRSVGAAGTFKALSSVGVRPDREGNLSFDATSFAAALDQDPTSVMRLFRTGGDSSHPKVSLVYAGSKIGEGTYQVQVTAAATKASLTGSAAPGLTVTAGVNDSLQVAVDGGATVSVTLEAKTYASTQALAQEVQTRVNAALTGGAVTVGVDEGGHLTLTSNRWGSGSKAQLVGGTALGTLSLSAASAAGTDVVGTLNGEPATGAGHTLRGNAGNATTDGLQVLAEVATSATITVSKGVFSLFDESLAGLTDPLSGTVGAKGTALDRSIADVQSRIEAMDRRLEARRESLLAQFLRMEKAVGQFNSQSSFLTNALEGIKNNWK
ncbi:MAG: flagellar filament capping protein FliD [Deferrisomatales bacterium]